MRRLARLAALLIAGSLFQNLSLAQDSLNALPGWKAESRKLGVNRYELSFTLPASNGWQVYAPNQVLLETKTTELHFSDSSVRQEGAFLLTDKPVTITSPIFDNAKVDVLTGQVSWKANIVIDGAVPAKLQGQLLYTYGKNDEFYPSTAFTFNVALEGGVTTTSRILVSSIDINHPASRCGDELAQNKSLFVIFLLGFVGGLIALLTPCVFPMIPVTVTFFTKKSAGRGKGIANAVLYGFFIFLIYILITVPFHIASKTTNPEVFNNISTNVWLNLLFFAIFVVFALSFFGLFEIGLPAGLANKMDSKSGLGNLGGIFFMAATLTIVSFSCTGPILGGLLVGVLNQGAWPLTAGAAGFGLALGLPFALFAMFPHWLQSLPKSGGWMTDVKVVLAFIELALAIKFLSNADLVQQWGLLKREAFIGSWIIISLLLVLFLAGKLRIGHSSPVKKFSAIRIFFILLFASFTIYLVPGLTNSKYADLRLISGFPPPRSYSFYEVEHSVFEPIHNDYMKALALSKKEHKPILIDFTGWACVNCRKMEEKIWTDPMVDSLMRTKFIVVSLYVDERKKLPLTEQTVFTTKSGNEKSIVTVGDKWSTFQTENFGATSQPQYAIISPDEKALTLTKFFTESADEFAEWLRCGLQQYDSKSN